MAFSRSQFSTSDFADENRKPSFFLPKSSALPLCERVQELNCSLDLVHASMADSNSERNVTRYATTLNPKAGLGLQRWSARRQPVVQAQILVVQGLLCGN